MKRSKVRILQPVAGEDFGFAPGSLQFIDADQARNWEAQGTCFIFPDESLTADERAACAHDGGEKQFTGPRRVP